jgi:hypothetical protein
VTVGEAAIDRVPPQCILLEGKVFVVVVLLVCALTRDASENRSRIGKGLGLTENLHFTHRSSHYLPLDLFETDQREGFPDESNTRCVVENPSLVEVNKVSPERYGFVLFEQTL